MELPLQLYCSLQSLDERTNEKLVLQASENINLRRHKVTAYRIPRVMNLS
jgi:hypothetical protein